MSRKTGLISETHFTQQSFTKMKGYDFYHTPHPAEKERGVSAVLIKESIIHQK